MTQPPLGQVCLRLGLLDGPQVERVLQEMRQHGQGRFGELAVELNLLNEDSLALALADQFHFPLLPTERLAHLSVAREVLGLLPVSLVRGGLVLPTWLDQDRRTLSVITSDPTDLPSLQAVLRHSRADRLRVFVAARSALLALIDRLLPAGISEEDEAPEELGPGESHRRAGTVVLEGDVEVAAALRRLDRAEGSRSMVVQDPEQVTAVLRAGQADRVLLRDTESLAAGPYLPSWRKARSGVQIATVRGFGAGRRFALDHRLTRGFYQEVLIRLLADESTRRSSEAGLRRAARLALEVGREVDLSDEVCEAVALLAIVRSSRSGEGAVDGSSQRPADGLLSGIAAPWDLDGLLAAFERRLNRPTEVSEHLPSEVLLGTTRLLDLREERRTQDLDGLDAGPRLHPQVLTAARRVVARRLFRAQLLSAGAREANVLLVCPDAGRTRQLARLVDGLGFETWSAPSVEGASACVDEVAPCLVVGEGLDAGGDDASLAALTKGRFDLLLTEAVPEAELAQQIRRRAASPGEGVDRTPTATADCAIQPIGDTLRMLSEGGLTATVQVFRTGESGLVRVVGGAPWAARLGSTTGDEALERIVGLTVARYSVNFGQTAEVDDPALLVRGLPRS